MHHETRQMNVSKMERWGTGIGGGLLLLTGLSRLRLSSLMMIAAGGALIARGLTGRCPIYRQLGISTQREMERGQGMEPGRSRFTEEGDLFSAPERDRDFDVVTEASEESFPASDAPGWSPSTRRYDTEKH